MITIVDYGLGNLGSIENMLRKLGVASQITSDLEFISKATKLILPGVGSFDNGMENLNKRGLTKLLEQRVKQDKIPILGICLGAQLMTRSSDEGQSPGLGWIDAATIKFFSKSSVSPLKVPNMGWHELAVKKHNSLIDQDAPQRFYFVHSYHFLCNNVEDVIATTHYGYEYAASFSRENIYGVQFHPEKSHKFGLNLFEKFSLI